MIAPNTGPQRQPKRVSYKVTKVVEEPTYEDKQLTVVIRGAGVSIEFVS